MLVFGGVHPRWISGFLNHQQYPSKQGTSVDGSEIRRSPVDRCFFGYLPLLTTFCVFFTSKRVVVWEKIKNPLQKSSSKPIAQATARAKSGFWDTSQCNSSHNANDCNSGHSTKHAATVASDLCGGHVIHCQQLFQITLTLHFLWADGDFANVAMGLYCKWKKKKGPKKKVFSQIKCWWWFDGVLLIQKGWWICTKIQQNIR